MPRNKCEGLKKHSDKNQFAISTLASVAIVTVVLVVGLAIGIDFLFSKKSSMTGNMNTSAISSRTSAVNSSMTLSYSSSSTSAASTSLTVSTTVSATSLSHSTSISSPPSSSSNSIKGSVNYSPACFPLYTSGGVHVFGALASPTSSSISVQSAKLYWSYHGQNQWYWLNDLTFSTSFSSNGNFSHYWNPPEAAYYDFEANWTLSNGQTVTAITPEPFQVVAQGSSCS